MNEVASAIAKSGMVAWEHAGLGNGSNEGGTLHAAASAHFSNGLNMSIVPFAYTAGLQV